MKRIFQFFMVCAALLGLSASAQEKGDMAVGLNLGVAPSLESGAKVTNFDLGAKFQYNVTNPIRVEAALDYGFKNKGVDVLTIGVNAHYIFKVADKISVYPLVGIGYAHCGVKATGIPDMGKIDWGGLISGDADIDDIGTKSESGSADKFYFNVGAGAEYALNEKLSVGLEIKYQYIKDFSRLPISLSASYKF